ncbi:MAG: Uma2 family endonuclease [Chloroflexi bacterium]|nr:Uma2 family endonuclease [Chloroflexota bacterium]MDL1882445.1 Uma2 family endonuclease [Anaerolineae bacterium CFX8]
MIQRVETMTVAEFVRLYDTEGPFEIINGKAIRLSPGVFRHDVYLIRLLFRALDEFVRSHQLGEVFSEMPFVLIFDSDWVKDSRTPDVMFVKAEWLAEYQVKEPDFADKPLVIVLDLVVEVISSNDNYTDVDAKVERYLDDGVQVVWVVDPRRKTIKVQRQGTYRTLHIGDVLTGDEVIPGFEQALQAVFG